MTLDPFDAHLRRADELFRVGEFRQAGQIWQAILKRDPIHAESREKLLQVKQALEAAAPPPVQPLANREEIDTLLRQGSQLWDMGVPEDAIEKWERVLRIEPENAAARAFIELVNRDMGNAASAAQAPKGTPDTVFSAVSWREAGPAGQDSASKDEIDTLLRQASQLWDLGVPEDAIEKWEQVLRLDPRNEEAKAFIERVTREQAEEAAAPVRPSPVVVPPPPPPQAAVSRQEPTTALPSQLQDGEDPRLRQGEHLLDLRRFDEAVFSFQQVLAQHPGNPRAREGLARAQAAATPVAAPKPVSLPATVTAAPNRRLGLDVPAPFRALAAHPLLQSPLTWAGAFVLFLLVSLGFSFWRQAAKDRQLKADVNQLIQQALIPVVRASEVVNLDESSASILAEARTSAADDPLRAYHRAKEVLRRSPEDPAAAQLLEQARTLLAAPEADSKTAPAQKSKPGDIDGALGAVLQQLRTAPDDPKLLRKAAALLGTLAQLQASNAKWGAAREHLLRARALYPQDKAWNARIYLLDRIQSQPKAEQVGWAALLW